MSTTAASTSNSVSVSIPATMHSIRIHSTGGPEVLQYDDGVPVPQPKPTEVLVRVAYCGVNYIDTYHRTGLYKLPLPAPIGREGAGIVVAVGSDIKKFQINDNVVFFSQGAYSEYITVDQSSLYKLPAAIDHKTAAAAFLQGLTAHYLCTSSYKIQSGDTILVHAAAGGTGSLIVQIGRLLGATVIGTVGSAAKAEIAKSAGANHVIDYSINTDWYSEVMRLTNNQGCNAVYDGVGASTYSQSLKSVRKLGTLVMFGNASGPVPPINILDLSNAGSISLIRPSLQHYISSPGELDRRSSELFAWISSGAVKLKIEKEFPVSEAADAHRLLESRKVAGKIVLKVQ